ncbi:hypothetical protein ACIQNG_34170 [Streptomyces sp. NPDC091377]|uniref:hypothetical protein n=1 Tax=Streptomyces sp. NPDC091377 TaxID=3365995 RepID=UPI0038195ECF
MGSPWPPRSSDPAGLLAAYTAVLGWPLLAGGAEVTAGLALRLLDRDPGTVISTSCAAAGVDAVTVPAGAVGRVARALEGHPVFQHGAEPVPILLGPDGLTLLVRQGSAPALDGVRVAAGADLLPLPPTGGVSWDTPPWQPLRRSPAVLPDGAVLRPFLADAVSQGSAGRGP